MSRSSLLLLSLLVGGAVFLRAEGKSSAASNVEAVTGIWVLQQVGSIEELKRLEPAIDDALANFDTVGFCLRYPWRAADKDFALLEEGRRIATKHGKVFSVRFMAGRHTPDRVFDDGCPHYRVRAWGQRTGTERVPSPVQPDGAFNAVFEKHYEAYVARLASWCRENGVRLLHLAWYGQDWAELNNGMEVRAEPGYTYDRWFDAHTRLIDIGLKHAGPDLAVEFPFSGHGPSGDTCSQFADHVWSSLGAHSDHFFFQGNGWGPDQVWGSPSQEMETMKSQAFDRPVNRGLQMIQPQDYDWAATFRHLHRHNATYGEVYVPSFRLAGRATLQKEISRFAEHCRKLNGPRAPRGPLAAPANAMQARRDLVALEAKAWVNWRVSSPSDGQRPPTDTPADASWRALVPWSAVDDRYAVLDAALQQARTSGRELALEFLIEGATPARVNDANFAREFEKAIAHVASWCRLNGVALLNVRLPRPHAALQPLIERQNGRTLRATTTSARDDG